MAILAALPRPSMTKNDGLLTSPHTFAGSDGRAIEPRGRRRLEILIDAIDPHVHLQRQRPAGDVVGTIDLAAGSFGTGYCCTSSSVFT